MWVLLQYAKLAIGFGTMVIKPQDDETFHSGTATATTSITSLKYYGQGFAQFHWIFQSFSWFLWTHLGLSENCATRNPSVNYNFPY